MKINDLDNKVLEMLVSKIEPTKVNVLDLRVGDVCRCIMGEKYMAEYVDEQDMTITEKIGFMKGLINGLNNVFSVFKKYNNDVPAEYSQACAEVGDALPMGESIITDCVEWYSLHSTKEAEDLPFCDWFVMKRKQALNEAITRRYQSIVNKKYEQQQRNIRH